MQLGCITLTTWVCGLSDEGIENPDASVVCGVTNQLTRYVEKEGKELQIAKETQKLNW